MKEETQTPKLTPERLRSLLHYDPESGLFNRKVGVKGFSSGTRAGTLHKASGYVYVGVDRKHYRAHRLAWLYMTGEWPIEIDHANGFRSDNRFANLREATRTLNNANGKKRSDNTSGYKGVSWDKRDKRWRAYINIKGKQKSVGYFRDVGDAIKARRATAELHFGEFSRHE